MNDDILFSDSPEEGTRLGLLALMTGISEHCWCAGWMTGLEEALWRVPPETNYGQQVITERQSLLLMLLSSEAGGWWRWSDEKGCAVFVETKVWLEYLEAERKKS